MNESQAIALIALAATLLLVGVLWLSPTDDELAARRAMVLPDDVRSLREDRPSRSPDFIRRALEAQGHPSSPADPTAVTDSDPQAGDPRTGAPTPQP